MDQRDLEGGSPGISRQGLLSAAEGPWQPAGPSQPTASLQAHCPVAHPNAPLRLEDPITAPAPRLASWDTCWSQAWPRGAHRAVCVGGRRLAPQSPELQRHLIPPRTMLSTCSCKPQQLLIQLVSRRHLCPPQVRAGWLGVSLVEKSPTLAARNPHDTAILCRFHPSTESPGAHWKYPWVVLWSLLLSTLQPPRTPASNGALWGCQGYDWTGASVP